MDPLEAQSRRLLDAYKAKASPSSREAEEVWSEIVARADRDAAHPERSRRAIWAWVAGGGAIAAGVMAWVLVSRGSERVPAFAGPPTNGLSADLRAAEEDPLQAVRKPRRSPARVEPASPAAPELLEDASVEPQAVPEAAEKRVEETPAPSRRAQRRSKAVRPETEAPASDLHDTLHRERELLEQARAALASGEASRALAAVRDYRRTHPNGLLREEMALLEVRTLCHLGQDAAWKRARARFLAYYPGSPLAAHLDDRDCRP